jgi:hypothetical protein
MFVNAAQGWEAMSVDLIPPDRRLRVAKHGQGATYQQRGGDEGEVLKSTFQIDERPD